MATAKHKFQKIVFNPANQELADFLDEHQKLSKNAFGIAAHASIEQFIYAKMPPHLKKSKNQAHLETGTYEKIVTHLERELELNGLEATEELPINNVSQQPTNHNAVRPKPTCHHCKKPWNYRNQCRLLKKQREQTENNQNNPGNKNSDANTSNPNNNFNNNNNYKKNSNKAERKPKTVYPPCDTCGKQTTPQRNATLEPMQPIDRLPGIEDRKDKIRYQRDPIKRTLMKLLKLQPKI